MRKTTCDKCGRLVLIVRSGISDRATHMVNADPHPLGLIRIENGLGFVCGTGEAQIRSRDGEHLYVQHMATCGGGPYGKKNGINFGGGAA